MAANQTCQFCRWWLHMPSRGHKAFVGDTRRMWPVTSGQSQPNINGVETPPSRGKADASETSETSNPSH